MLTAKQVHTILGRGAVCLLLAASLATADESKPPKPPKLFATNDTLEITISAPWRDIQRQSKKQGAYPAELSYTSTTGQRVTLPLTVERRGVKRQEVCSFPPIRLRFEKAAVKNTVFRGQKSLKMVTHCESSKRYDQYYVLEMLAYRIYNLVTDYSFRVRPLSVSYVESKGGKSGKPRFAFLIEDDSDVAKRNGLKKVRIPRISTLRLKPGLTSEFSLFQYMIGNTDWAALSGPDPNECCHNVKLIGPDPLQPDDKVYPIPYDFDSSGLVNAPYAAPPRGLPISNVTQRLYRGYCTHNAGLQAAREEFLSLEPAVYELLDQETRLNASSRKRARKYLGKFYGILKDQRAFNKYVIARCRK